MSQKTNPTSLRLQKNLQNFSSPFFADRFWSETYQAYFESQKYISSFLKETSFSEAFFSAKIFYRKLSVWLFLQDNRVTNKEKLLFFKKSLSRNVERKSRVSKKLKLNSVIFDTENKKTNTISLADSLFFKEKRFNKDLISLKKVLRDDFLKAKQGFFKDATCTERDNYIKRKESATIFPKIFARPCFSLCENVLSSSYRGKKNIPIYNALLKTQDSSFISKNKAAIESFTDNNLFQNKFSTSKEIRNFIEEVQKRKISFHLCNDAIKTVFFPTNISFEPIRFIREDQNVTALADLVVTLLERRISFRQIKSLLFKDLLDNPQIKGVRISCSGRLGGRSKKAQKAKVQSDSCGATTLAAFSSKILFASKSASTSYGKVGVKIWLSFDDKRCLSA